MAQFLRESARVRKRLSAAEKRLLASRGRFRRNPVEILRFRVRVPTPVPTVPLEPS